MKGIRIKRAISSVLEMLSVTMVNEPNEDRWYDETNKCIFIHNNSDTDIEFITSKIFDFFKDYNPLGFYIEMGNWQEDSSLSYIKFVSR